MAAPASAAQAGDAENAGGADPKLEPTPVDVDRVFADLCLAGSARGVGVLFAHRSATGALGAVLDDLVPVQADDRAERGLQPRVLVRD